MREEKNTHNLLVSDDNVKPMQHGVFDPAMLCAECDALLGKLDDFAIRIWRRFPKHHRTVDDGFIMDCVDGDRISKFILSILWRASTSTRPECRSVSLGASEALVQEVVFGIRPLSHIPMYQLLLSRFLRHPRFNPAHNCTLPISRNIEGFRAWSFSLYGFSVLAKLDIMPFPVD